MFGRNDYGNDGYKIPYDDEPISRNEQNQKMRSNSQPQGSTPKKKLGFVDFFQFLLCLLLIIAVVMLNNQLDVVGNQRETYNINVDTETSNLAFASAKGMLSTVNVSAVKATQSGNPSVKIENEVDFFQSSYSLGSGVIYSLDKSSGSAYIITNYHVVADLSGYANGFGFYYVLLWDSSTPIKAQYMGGSYVYDIAVLYVANSEEIKQSSCVQATIADSTSIVIGEECVAIGNSMGRNLGVSNGCIRVEEVVFSKSYSTYVTYLSHTASVNSGNSGGGLFDYNGELIGIVNAKFSDVSADGTLTYYEVVHGMFYAIPSNIALSVANNIIRNGGILTMPSIGLVYGEGYSWESRQTVVGDNGMQTRYELIVSKNTGEFVVGDKLLAVTYNHNGKEIVVELNHISSIESNIFNWGIGDKVTFKVQRGEDIKQIVVNISNTTKIK